MTTEKFADLHIHTHYSDSTLSPQDVVKKAVSSGLACISITDHDTVSGIKEAQEAVALNDLELIPGIELSSENNGDDIHILGYYMDINNQAFLAQLDQMQAFRVKRLKEMIEKLKEFGINNIASEEVLALTKSNAVGRLHLAIILKQKGWVANLRAAFNKYLGEDGSAYVGKYKQTPQEAIEFIRSFGGVAVLAHPMATKRDELIPGLVSAGLQGLEVYYANYSKATFSYYEGLAKKHKLILTGGSDDHGDAKVNTHIGKARVPYEYIIELKRLAGK